MGGATGAVVGGVFIAATACSITLERPVLGGVVVGVVEPPLLEEVVETSVVVGVVVVLTVKVYLLLPSVTSLGCGGMYGVGCGYVCGGGDGGGHPSHVEFGVGVVCFVVVVVDEP